MPRQKIGIIGAGEVGQTLASGFYCGNDAAAKAWVATVLEQFGWEAADMGTAVAAHAIEPLARLWRIPGFRQDHWTHAFHVLWS